MTSVRTRRTTYLCLKGDPYSGLYTDFVREANSTPPAGLCSVLPPSESVYHVDADRASASRFHYYLCRQRSAAEWMVYIKGLNIFITTSSGFFKIDQALLGIGSLIVGC